MNWTEQDYLNHVTRLRTARLKAAQKARLLDKPVAVDVPVLEMVAPVDKPKRRRNLRIEWSEQCAYFAHINACLDAEALAIGFFLAMPEYPGADLIHAIQNENAAGIKVGADLKKAGRRAGVPDIFIAVPRIAESDTGHAVFYSGAFIEMKKPNGVPSDVSKMQSDWHNRLRQSGYKAVVCFGAKEALDFTRDYLGWAE